MLKRTSAGLWLAIVVLAMYYVRKLPAWDAVQRMVSHLPAWLVTIGAVVALAVWVWYVLPEGLARQLSKWTRMPEDISIFWLGLVSFITAPLGIYYVKNLASDVKRTVYGGVFILLILALGAKTIGEERSERRPAGRARNTQ
jgi:hypothetical protein